MTDSEYPECDHAPTLVECPFCYGFCTTNLDCWLCENSGYVTPDLRAKWYARGRPKQKEDMI